MPPSNRSEGSRSHPIPTRYRIIKDGWGNRPNFQHSHGLNMVPDDIEEGNRVLDEYARHYNDEIEEPYGYRYPGYGHRGDNYYDSRHHDQGPYDGYGDPGLESLDSKYLWEGYHESGSVPASPSHPQGYYDDSGLGGQYLDSGAQYFEPDYVLARSPSNHPGGLEEYNHHYNYEGGTYLDGSISVPVSPQPQDFDDEYFDDGHENHVGVYGPEEEDVYRLSDNDSEHDVVPVSPEPQDIDDGGDDLVGVYIEPSEDREDVTEYDSDADGSDREDYEYSDDSGHDNDDDYSNDSYGSYGSDGGEDDDNSD